MFRDMVFRAGRGSVARWCRGTVLRARSPIKVHEATKHKVRYAALMAGVELTDLVEKRSTSTSSVTAIGSQSA